MNKKGFFVSFEGPDFSGKTDNSIRLVQMLQQRGYDAVLLREPGGTKVGEKVRAILNNKKLKIDSLTELLLFCAARNQICKEIIRSSLQEGRVIALDRFKDSTLAFDKLPKRSCYRRLKS